MIITRGHAVRRLFAALPFAAALAAVQPIPAEAASFREAWTEAGSHCFARLYDSRHLASHPRQRLTRFSLSDSDGANPVDPGTFDVDFDFSIKGDSEVFGSVATCRDAPGAVHCVIEADGGEFTMRRDGPNLLLKISRMEVEGPEDFSPDLAVGGDDRVVRLFPSPRNACRSE